MACHLEDNVETYLGSAALFESLFEFTFLDSPEHRASGYPERWGMTSLLGVDFGGSSAVVVGAIPDDEEEFDTKTKFDDVEDDEDDDFDDEDEDEDDEDDEDDDDFDDDDDEDDEDDEDEEFDEEF